MVVILARKSHFTKYDSDYTKYMMKEIQKNPPEIYERRSKAVEKFQKEDFDLLGGMDSERRMFEWACRQTYILPGNMLTSAAMIGIDSCPIEGFQQKEINEVLAKDFDIDTDKYGVSVMTTFGYRIKEPRAKTRKEIGEVVEWF